jgi:hypothetical protein
MHQLLLLRLRLPLQRQEVLQNSGCGCDSCGEAGEQSCNAMCSML